MKYIYQFVIAILVLYLGSVLEPLFYPVVMNWTVTDRVMETDIEKGNKFFMSGYMNKVRNCKFLAVTVHDNNNIKLATKFLDNVYDDAENRPTGSQKWGYWVVKLRDDSSELTVQAHHSCLPLWTTVTTLGKVNVYIK